MCKREAAQLAASLYSRPTYQQSAQCGSLLANFAQWKRSRPRAGFCPSKQELA